jgi:hypothetical protein
MALRAALESAVQLGPGDESNRQAEMVNPMKCRDSLQSRGLVDSNAFVLFALPFQFYNISLA